MSDTNPNSRLETFCDGVFAIALTLLIIDVKIPSGIEINSTGDFWHALGHTIPLISAFILSFTIILITWVNHHNNFRLINKTSNSFIYANGFLLLTVVFVPFPTALIGEHILTNHPAPAVILYNSVLALQAMGWILSLRAVIKDRLSKSEKAYATIRQNLMFGYFAFLLYTVCAILASWFPLTIVTITTITWIFWLVWGINLKNEY